MSLALLEVVLEVSAGLKVTHTQCSKVAVSPKSAQQSIESKRRCPSGLKKRFFQAVSDDPAVLRGNRAVCNEGERD
jgi:hypothetical protein